MQKNFYDEFDILTSIDLQVVILIDHKLTELIMMLFNYESFSS
jgi:hypothetical protein